MAQQTVNLGSAPNDNTGDSLRVGGDKINDNFTENYASIAALEADVADLQAGIASINAQTGTTYTFVSADSGKLCTFANASPVTVTLATNATQAFTTGARIDVIAKGAGAVSIDAVAGVTINGVDNVTVTLDGQYAGVTLWKYATNDWFAVGKLA